LTLPIPERTAGVRPVTADHRAEKEVPVGANRLSTQRLACSIARECFLTTRPVMKTVVLRAVRATIWASDCMSVKARADAIHLEANRVLRLKVERFHRLPEPDGPGVLERFEEYKRRNFWGAIRGRLPFRQTESGVHHVGFDFVDRPEDVRAEGISTPGAKYPNAWARTRNSIHRLFVHRLWYSRVEKEGLSLRGRHLTLYAQEQLRTTGSELAGITVVPLPEMDVTLRA
jgi:hypothetical protein